MLLFDMGLFVVSYGLDISNGGLDILKNTTCPQNDYFFTAKVNFIFCSQLNSALPVL